MSSFDRFRGRDAYDASASPGFRPSGSRANRSADDDANGPEPERGPYNLTGGRDGPENPRGEGGRRSSEPTGSHRGPKESYYGDRQERSNPRVGLTRMERDGAGRGPEQPKPSEVENPGFFLDRRGGDQLRRNRGESSYRGGQNEPGAERGDRRHQSVLVEADSRLGYVDRRGSRGRESMPGGSAGNMRGRDPEDLLAARIVPVARPLDVGGNPCVGLQQGDMTHEDQDSDRKGLDEGSRIYRDEKERQDGRWGRGGHVRNDRRPDRRFDEHGRFGDRHGRQGYSGGRPAHRGGRSSGSGRYFSSEPGQGKEQWYDAAERASRKRPAAPHWGRKKRDTQGRAVKPRRASEKEPPIDLWCYVCCRGLQDKNSMAAHLTSRKHVQAVEEQRRSREAEEDSGGEDLNEQHFFVEKSIVSEAEKFKILEGDKFKSTPKAFQEWANRSLAAACAKDAGDPSQKWQQAVMREIIDEMCVHEKNGSIAYQSWAKREKAVGTFYLKEKPKLLALPMFDVSKKASNMHPNPAHERVSGSTHGLGVEAGKVRKNKGASTDVIDISASFVPQKDPSMRPHEQKSSRVLTGEAANSESPAANGGSSRTANTHRGVGPSRSPLVDSQGGVMVRDSGGSNVDQAGGARSLASDEGARSTKESVERSEFPGLARHGDRPRPAPPSPSQSQCDPRGRNSRFQLPTRCSKAAAITSTIIGGDPSAIERTGAIFSRDLGRSTKFGVQWSGVGRDMDDQAPSQFSSRDLRERLHNLEKEFTGEYIYDEFVGQVRDLIVKLEDRDRRYSPTLVGAYELLIDAILAQDAFREVVLPCSKLMEAYRALSKRAALPRRDEFTAYFVMSLLIDPKPRTLSPIEKNRVGLAHDPGSQLASPSSHLARMLPDEKKYGKLTKHALAVVKVVMSGEYFEFFNLYNMGIAVTQSSRGLAIQNMMDSLVDIVRSKALISIYYATDAPSRYPLKAAMFKLNWFDAALDRYETEEARHFVQKLGLKIMNKHEDYAIRVDGSTEFVLCDAARARPQESHGGRKGGPKPEWGCVKRDVMRLR